MTAGADEMIEAIETCLRLDEDFELDEWEEAFFISLQTKLKAGGKLTEKQLAKLEEIYDRT